MKYMYRALVVLSLLSPCFSHAGVDLGGKVMRVQLNSTGNLWFKMDNPQFDTYCKPGWHGFSMYIPKSDPDFPYYYSIIMTSVANGKSLYIANISKFNGTTPCDLTLTGYGVVIDG